MSTDGISDQPIGPDPGPAAAEGERSAWKILIACSDAGLHARAQRTLAGIRLFGRNTQLLEARSSAEAIERVLRNPDVAVLVAQTRLEHDRAGLDTVEAIRGSLRQHRVRIVLCTETGATAPAHDFAVRHDVQDSIGNAELTDQTLLALVRAALGHFHQLAALERTRADLREMLDTNERVNTELINAMAAAVKTGSSETGNHMRRVAEYARLLGRLAGLDGETADLLYRAAPLHDTGAIPEAVRTHAAIGQQMLSRHETPVLQAAAIIAGEHHERWDGLGYPSGYRGEQIHIFSRITALADVFDALCHPRCYKGAWPLERTLQYLREERGARFDPALIDLFMDNLDQFVAVYSRLTDPPLMH